MANAPVFIWYELMTTNAAAAARFYSAVVGWQISEEPDAAGSEAAGGQDYRMIARDDGGFAGGVLPLTKQMCDNGAKPVWLTYFDVPDVDAAVKAILADGGTLQMPKSSLPVGDIAMVTDPAGAPFYVMRPVPPPGQPESASDVFDARALQRVRWNELSSENLSRAKPFYAKHFGFEFNEVMSMGPAGDYCFIDQGGQRLGAMMQKVRKPDQPGEPLSGWLFYFAVPSASAAKAAVEKGGGSIVSGPHPVPSGDIVFVAHDPQGAVFGIAGGP